MTIDIDNLAARLAAALGPAMQLRDVLGVGGFAAVFRAYDPRLEREVAIKVIDPALGISAEREERFLREARVVAAIEHPHIVPLYAAESRDGLLFLVMRLFAGNTLADRIAADGALAPSEASRLALEIAEALAFAHARGVVHRDVKPENILLDAAGNATVSDFGISLVVGKPAAGEMPGVTVGTPSYISPEQALGEDVDGRADVYSLGAMLFEMLTGRVPFEGRTVHELIAMHIAAPPPKIATLKPETPTALADLVERMLAKRPDDRPDADAVVRALMLARAPDALLSPREISRRRRRKRLTYLGVAAGTAIAVLWGGGTLVLRSITGVTRAMNSGSPPTLDALGAAVPDSVVAAARADGVLHDGEVASYAFIPAGRSMADAMVITDSAIIRRQPGRGRRIALGDANIDLNFKDKRGTGGAVGAMIVRVKDAPPDTVYSGLTGLEFSRLRTSISVVLRSSTAAKKP